MDYTPADENVPPLQFLSPEPFLEFEDTTDCENEQVDQLNIPYAKPHNKIQQLFTSDRSNLILREHFQCGKCGKMLTTRQGLRNHISRTHSDARPFKCKNCDATFKSSSNLNDHEKMIHKNVTYTCVVCEKVTPYRSNMKKHLRTHCSTVSEVKSLWDEHYATDHGRRLTAARTEERVNEHVEVSVVTDIAKLNVPPPTRSQRMKLGKFVGRQLQLYHQGLVYPKTEVTKLENMFHDDENGNSVFTPSFSNRECPLCPEDVMPRALLLKHIDTKHEDDKFFDNYCRICLTTTSNLEEHMVEGHKAMEAAVQDIVKATTKCIEPMLDRPLFDQVEEDAKTRTDVL